VRNLKDPEAVTECNQVNFKEPFPPPPPNTDCRQYRIL